MSRTFRPTPERRGFSLVESLIVMSVMLLILVAAQQFAAGGVDFYRSSVQSLEVQQATLVALTRMADELENSNLDKILVPPAPANNAVVFPSPARLDGTMTANTKGVMLWNSIICYAQRTLPNGETVVERKIEAHAPVDYPPDPLTIAGGARDVVYFTPLPPTGVMASRVAVPPPGDPPCFEVVKSTDKIVITLKVEFSQRTKDSMKVQTQVFPKN